VLILIGVVLTQATAADGLRYSTSRAFLYPVLHRKNLHVLDDSQVTKVETVIVFFVFAFSYAFIREFLTSA
jgi:Na+/proline symporter